MIMKWIRRVLIVIAFIGVIAGAGYIFRADITLELGGIAVKRLYGDIGPNQEIDWNRADATANRSEDNRPNIIVIVADDLGWNDISLGGGGVADGTVPTPHIDSIASEGVQFSNGYAGHATCAPSRAALMSGRYPTRFGFESTPTPGSMLRVVAFIAEVPDGFPPIITHFDEKGDQDIPAGQKGMPTDEVTMAETLKQAGYHTVHVGKWHLGRRNGMAAEDQGFDESLMMHSGKYLPLDDPNVVNAQQDFDPIDRFQRKAMVYATKFNSGKPFKPRGYLTDYFTDEAVKAIEANKNRPFFLYLAHWAVHGPLQAAKADYDALSHIKDHRMRVYAAMVQALDRGVGRVMEALKANGIDDNTLVIFTSDNGAPGYLGLPELNRPYRGWKLTFFEGGIHVPYFMRWPARIKPGSKLEAPVHFVDIYPTAAGAAGAPMPTDRIIDGVNLLDYIPNVTGTAPAKQGHNPHEKLFWKAGNTHVVLVDGWKYQRDHTGAKSWLFENKNDPTEQHNLVNTEPERVRSMEAMLDTHNAEQKKPAWPILLEAPTRIDKTLDAPVEPGEEIVYYSN
jgi:arylsulfatase A-like enzyme